MLGYKGSAKHNNVNTWQLSRYILSGGEGKKHIHSVFLPFPFRDTVGKSGKKWYLGEVSIDPYNFCLSCVLFRRPGHSQGLLYKHLRYGLINSLSDPWVSHSFTAAPSQPVKDSSSSYKIDYVIGISALKLNHWFKSCGHLSEGVDVAFWWSCIGKVLRLQPAQQACFFLV